MLTNRGRKHGVRLNNPHKKERGFPNAVSETCLCLTDLWLHAACDTFDGEAPSTSSSHPVRSFGMPGHRAWGVSLLETPAPAGAG